MALSRILSIDRILTTQTRCTMCSQTRARACRYNFQGPKIKMLTADFRCSLAWTAIMIKRQRLWKMGLNQAEINFCSQLITGFTIRMRILTKITRTSYTSRIRSCYSKSSKLRRGESTRGTKGAKKTIRNLASRWRRSRQVGSKDRDRLAFPVLRWEV